ncbi:chemotaxis protein CheW [Modestobacter lacusdianchii]
MTAGTQPGRPDTGSTTAGAPEAARVYGLLRLAGVNVALPLEVLREVVHCPADLAPLPARVIGLLGAMNLRGTVLPVVDLQRVLGPEAPGMNPSGGPSADRVVVVVACAGQVFGLLADEVRGVTRLTADRLLPVSNERGGLLFSHTFQHPDDGGVISVLDAAALLRETGVPTVLDTTRAGDVGPRSVEDRGLPGGDVRKLTLVRCGEHMLALDVAHVHTTLPPPVLRASVLDGGLCLGVIDYADREVPVVDSLALLGLGRLGDDELGAGLVLKLPLGYVVLALSELLDLVEVAETEVLPLPALAVPGGGLLSGVIQRSRSGPCLVVDGAALADVPELASLAAVNTSLDHAPTASRHNAQAAGDLDALGKPYMTYTAGVEVTTPLDQIAEILPLSATITATPSSDRILGVVVHREAVVPVVRLAGLLERSGEPPGPASCLLLVQTDDQVVAFAVDKLSGIEPVVWIDADHGTSPSENPGRLLQTARLVQVGDETRLLPELDLHALAGSLTEPSGPDPYRS